MSLFLQFNMPMSRPMLFLVLTKHHGRSKIGFRKVLRQFLTFTNFCNKKVTILSQWFWALGCIYIWVLYDQQGYPSCSSAGETPGRPSEPRETIGDKYQNVSKSDRYHYFYKGLLVVSHQSP